jgi:hypothetical protein
MVGWGVPGANNKGPLISSYRPLDGGVTQERLLFLKGVPRQVPRREGGEVVMSGWCCWNWGNSDPTLDCVRLGNHARANFTVRPIFIPTPQLDFPDKK